MYEIKGKESLQYGKLIQEKWKNMYLSILKEIVNGQ